MGQQIKPHRAERSIWINMRYRCRNPNAANYAIYGGRGISVCKEWDESFEVFFLHVGSRPTPQHSLERINNNGNYEPGNVKWATKKEQARNRRNNYLVTIGGITKCATEWEEANSLPEWTLQRRIKKGWPEKYWLRPVTRRQVIRRNGEVGECSFRRIGTRNVYVRAQCR